MHPNDLKLAFESGENITSILKQESDSNVNTPQMIETAYDLQAGTYARMLLEDEKIFSHKREYGSKIANEILSLTEPTSIIETGVGEGTTLSFVLNQLGRSGIEAHGFDISWSRIAWCKQWLASQWSGNCHLSVASLLNLPYADSCFDVVYTAHTIEPNGGKEDAILNELYRITSRFLVLIEPGYELASEEVKNRMDRLGYCKGLVEKAESMGMQVQKHELLGYAINPLNPSAITVIEKNADAPPQTPRLVCPNLGDQLIDFGDSLYSPNSLRAYPKIMGVPCLRCEDGVVASAYEKFADTTIPVDPQRPIRDMTGPQISSNVRFSDAVQSL
jgi:hypothetical protein